MRAPRNKAALPGHARIDSDKQKTFGGIAVEIREAQESLWQAGLALAGPDNDQLTGDNRQHGGLGVHLSDKGLQAHGRLWAEKVEAWLDTVRE